MCAQALSVEDLFCSLGYLSAFGVERGSDAQRLRSTELGPDALFVKSLKSKKGRPRLHGVLRDPGVSGVTGLWVSRRP